MATIKQNITRFKKFGEVPGLDKELDLVIKQINDRFEANDPDYGELYVEGTPLAITIAAPATYYKIEGMVKGHQNKIGVDPKGFVINNAGIYRISVTVAVNHSVDNSQAHVSIFVNEIENKHAESETFLIGASSYATLPLTAIDSLKVPDKIGIRVKSDKAGTMAIDHLNFNIERIK